MSAIQCPKCPLRYSWRTELETHLRDEHPDFTHEDYPAHHAHADDHRVAFPSRSPRAT